MLFIKKHFLNYNYYKKQINFDNSTTNQKPKILFKSIINCIEKKNYNINRGDHFKIIKNELIIKKIKFLIKKILNINYIEEILFFYNSSTILNFLINIFKNFLNYKNEILCTILEHNSIIIPLINLIKILNCKIKILPLLNNLINKNILCNYINQNTKICFFSQISNLGFLNNLKKISLIIKYNKIILILDGTQSVGYINLNIKKIKIDFYFFSLHKLYSMTGISVLYINIFYNNKTPINYFGSNIINYFNYKNLKFNFFFKKHESGTQNLISIISSYYSIKWFLTNKKKFFFCINYFSLFYKYIFKKKKKISIFLLKINNFFLFNYYLELNKCILRCETFCNNLRFLFYKKKKNCRITLCFNNKIKELFKIKFLIMFYNFKIIKY